MKGIEIEIEITPEDFIVNGYVTMATLYTRYVYDPGDFRSNETARPPTLYVDEFRVEDNNGRDITTLLTEECRIHLENRYCR